MLESSIIKTTPFKTDEVHLLLICTRTGNISFSTLKSSYGFLGKHLILILLIWLISYKPSVLDAPSFYSSIKLITYKNLLLIKKYMILSLYIYIYIYNKKKGLAITFIVI